MTVIQMSGQELTRLRIMIDLADGRITVEATAALMGLGRPAGGPVRRARGSKKHLFGRSLRTARLQMSGGHNDRGTDRP